MDRRSFLTLPRHHEHARTGRSRQRRCRVPRRFWRFLRYVLVHLRGGLDGDRRIPSVQKSESPACPVFHAQELSQKHVVYFCMGGQRLFWVLSFCLAMFCSGCRSSWQRHLAAGDAALHSGQLPRAQAHYARALKDAQAVAASLKGKIQALNSLAAIELAQGRPLPRKSTPAALLPRWKLVPTAARSPWRRRYLIWLRFRPHWERRMRRRVFMAAR